MKWNEAEMVALVGTRPADWEGKLTYRWRGKSENMDLAKFETLLLYRPPKGGGTFAKQQGYKVK